MSGTLADIIAFLQKHDGVTKARLTKLTADEFNLTKDRAVYYCKSFAVRFSQAATANFGNTVLSLSALQKFDDRPFIVCLVTPERNYLLLANTTFLKKISHSSHELRENNIRGSFNGSDIAREFEGIVNTSNNLERLFHIHEAIGFDGNLPRLVEATNNIMPTGKKFDAGELDVQRILTAPQRAIAFSASPDALTLKAELDARVEAVKNYIPLAALIDNVKIRGSIIEYLIAGDHEGLIKEIIMALRKEADRIPPCKSENALGDYSRVFNDFVTETDVKTKVMVLDSNPKAYNLDKMLESLASEHSVFMFYFVGLEVTRLVNTS